jgi:hypothetical protein
MTRSLPLTAVSVARTIKGVRRAGLFVVGVKPDGTVIVSDKPIDTGAFFPVDYQNPEPTPFARRFGENLNGGSSEA